MKKRGKKRMTKAAVVSKVKQMLDDKTPFSIVMGQRPADGMGRQSTDDMGKSSSAPAPAPTTGTGQGNTLEYLMRKMPAHTR